MEINLSGESVNKIDASQGIFHETARTTEKSLKIETKELKKERISSTDIAVMDGKTLKLKEEIIYTSKRPVFESRVKGNDSIFYDIKSIEPERDNFSDSMFIDI